MGGPGEGFPWQRSIYRWIEGEPAGIGILAEAGTLATEVASFVSALQWLDTAGAPRAGRGVEFAEQDADAREAIAASLEGELDTCRHGCLGARAGGATVAGPPLWIHGDLEPDNLLCRDGHLHAVIDFGGLGVGEPAADILFPWAFLPPVARDRCRGVLAVDAATCGRGRAWALSMALMQLPCRGESTVVIMGTGRQ